MTQATATRVPLVQSLLDAAATATLPGSQIAWLAAARRENLTAFGDAGLPDSRNEAWKYTSLRAMSQRKLGLVDADAARAQAVDGTTFALPDVDGERLVFVDGVYRADLSRIGSATAGLSVQPLSQALQTQSEPLRFALSRHYRDSADAFAQVNAALAADGVVLRVEAETTVAKPVHLVFLGGGQADISWHARVIVDIGAGARVTVVEHHLGVGEQAHLGTLVADVAVHEHASLDWIAIQDATAQASLFRRTRFHLGEQAKATLYALELGGAMVRHDLATELAGDGARFDSRGAFVLRGRQHVDTQLAVRHAARDTTSDALWRGVADERSRGVFRGAIVVAEGADGSDAALSNKNLLLSPLAEIDTKPELEIYADEVKAAHGATIGQLDERALFYLRSRGIDRAQARSLLTLAFCRTVMQPLPLEGLRDHLDQLLMAHLPHVSSPA
jgi:Fe-S cluster assembly protein SufD